MSSLKVHILFLYFSRNLKALWFPKSSNWINTVSPYLQEQKWCPIKCSQIPNILKFIWTSSRTKKHEIKDVRTHCYCASLVRTLFIRNYERCECSHDTTGKMTWKKSGFEQNSNPQPLHYPCNALVTQRLWVWIPCWECRTNMNT